MNLMNAKNVIVEYKYDKNGTMLGNPVRIYVGNHVAAQDMKFLTENDITVIVNCAKELPNIYSEVPFLRYYNVPVYDNGDPKEVAKMCDYLPKIVEQIYKEVLNGRNVLIHCAAGAQRSCTVMAAYLIRYHKYDLNKAMQYIRDQREVAFFHGANFLNALILYERHVNKMRLLLK